MCGIAGLVGGRERQSADELAALARSMAASLAHRGPDDEGCWVDEAAGVALGHRRLSIIDLSAHGHQPMVSASGRWVLVFNGELYNYRELRRRLDQSGAAFRGESDTEVLLHAIEAWGVEPAVLRSNGMFAFAAWDRHRQELTLVRDRVGEKPLYYAQCGSGLVFASELKAFHRVPEFRPAIDRESVGLLMRFGCVPAPRSIYDGVFKLLPGHLVTIPGSTVDRVAAATQKPYWSADLVAVEGTRATVSGDLRECIEATEDLIRDAVALRSYADVPVGAFLSGGVDSSLVTALMQAQSSRPVRTFTIGFEDRGYDESAHARRVARHLGTDHVETLLPPRAALDLVEHLPHWYDEPFGDSSQIPSLLISQVARQQVTVALSGDGGDELFAGYNRHQWAAPLWDRSRAWPAWVRQPLARRIRRLRPETVERRFAQVAPLLPRKFRVRMPALKLAKLGQVLLSDSTDELYWRLRSQNLDTDALVVGAAATGTATGGSASFDGLSAPERMLLLDLIGYLPDDILTKVDRASMSVGLEVRVPLLDHRLIEHAWKLPMDVKLRDGTTKWMLRQILRRHLPAELIDQPKMGFGVPLADWLRGDLRTWADDLLSPDLLRRQGYLHPEPVRSMWAEHRAGRADHAHALWNVLAFQAWLDHWSRPASAVPADSLASATTAPPAPPSSRR